MIILKGQVLHTTHSYTNHSPPPPPKKKKNRVQKERRQKKTKYTSIKQRKAILTLDCLIIYILFHPLQKHKANQRFWDSKTVKFPSTKTTRLTKALKAQGSSSYIIIQWRIQTFRVGGSTQSSRPWDKGGGGGGLQKIFSAFRARPQFDLKIGGEPGPPKLLS